MKCFDHEGCYTVATCQWCSNAICKELEYQQMAA